MKAELGQGALVVSLSKTVVCERLLIAASASWRKGLSRIVERFNALQQSQGQVLVCIIVFQLSN